eukprot:m.14383 g.14383  ORF g.14383 m.14383 type:complete len:493 (+) comp5075_c0_seq1:1-1479(+)
MAVNLNMVVGALLICCASATPQDSKPNLFFVMIDDWGYYNVGFRNPLIKTPVIDNIVKTEAALIERHYTFKYCSPTRRSFLSGRQPTHSGQDNSARATVDLRMRTIANKLSEAGYDTYQSGKWHAGHDIVFQTPHGRGFNTSLGYFNGACDHWTQKDSEDGCGEITDLWDTDRPAEGMNGTYGDYLYGGRAVDVIMNHDVSRPLFYYLATQCAHDPMEVPQRFLDIYPKTVPNQIEYAFSSVVDEVIDNVTKALRAKNMWENTLFVVSSDNGGPAFSDQHAASNFPLRGGKYTLFEGGIRVTAFVSGGLLPSSMAGKNISAPIHVCDWYATFSHLAGVDASDDHQGVPSIDSINQWPVISGSISTPLRNETFPATGVLIQGKYKLIATGPGTAKWSGPLYPKVPATGPNSLDCSQKSPCLFDIVNDPFEYQDIAQQNPTIVTSMLNRVIVLNNGTFEGVPPNVAKGAVCSMTKANGNFLTPSDWTPPLHSGL